MLPMRNIITNLNELQTKKFAVLRKSQNDSSRAHTAGREPIGPNNILRLKKISARTNAVTGAKIAMLEDQKLAFTSREQKPILLGSRENRDLSAMKELDVLEKLGVSQFSTLRWSFFQDVMGYAAAGFNSIGVWRGKLEEIGVDEAADLIFEMKLGVSSLSWVGGFTGCEGISFAAKIEDAIEAIQAAARLQAGCLIIHPGSINGHIRRHARRLLSDAIHILAPIATDYGVRLALEPMRACPATFLDGLDETIDFCEVFPPDQLGVVWDLFHVCRQTNSWETLRRVTDRIVLVQVADCLLDGLEAIRCPVGYGKVPIGCWCKYIADLGFAGPWEIEQPIVNEHGPCLRDQLSRAFKFVSACRRVDRTSDSTIK